MWSLSAGQEDLIRAMLAAVGDWRFDDAHALGAKIVSRYTNANGARAEVQLVHREAGGLAGSVETAVFRVSIRSSAGADAVRALFRALIASVRARERDLRWTVASEAANEPSPVVEEPRDERVVAALARFRSLEERGRCAEALSAGDADLDALNRPPELLIASASLRASLHDDDRAAELAREALTGPMRARAALLLAKLGNEDAPQTTADAIASDPRMREVRAAIYAATGDYARAAAVHAEILASTDARSSRLALGTYHAWLGDSPGALAHARALLDVNGTDREAHGLCAAAYALAGRIDDALVALERADLTSAGSALLRAECWMKQDELERARDEIIRAGDLTHDRTTHVSAMILRAAIFERLATPEPCEPGLVSAMSQIAPDAPQDFARALGAMRGNRSETPTFVRDDGTLARVRIPRSARLASKYALWRFVATASTEETERDFDRVHAQFPGVPEPYNYRGELWLYVGDAQRARRCFEQALVLYPRSRWAFIGLGAVALLEGDPKETLAVIERGIQIAGGPGPTAYAYRGEAHRILGNRDAARADLQHAVTTHPTRIGASVNLALLYAECGDRDAFDATMPALRRTALYADAGGTDSRETLDEMLRMLRGNRASTCVTYFARDGAVCTIIPRRG